MRKDSQHSCTPKDWESVFGKAGVLVEELAALKSSRARATKIGQFFGPLLGREVPIQARGRTGKAVLRVEEGRSKERRYYFEVFWDGIARHEKPLGDVPPSKSSGRDKTKTARKKEAYRRRNRFTKAKARKKKGGGMRTREGQSPISTQDGKQATPPTGGGNNESW